MLLRVGSRIGFRTINLATCGPLFTCRDHLFPLCDLNGRYTVFPLRTANRGDKVTGDCVLPPSFTGDTMQKAIDLNKILGSRYIVMSTAGRVTGIDGWKSLGETITKACEKFRTVGLRAGYHNHQAEFRAFEGKRPIKVLAASTPKDFMWQFDVGACVEVGSDPVAWIEANPGRIDGVHCKDWAPGTRQDEQGYRVLFGEGVCPWPKIFEAAEGAGGVEYYLIEEEGSRYAEAETARRCLDNW